MYKTFGKRFFDIILAAAGLIILSPLFTFLTLLLFFSTGGQPFFLQSRPGLNCKPFVIIKFKTMRDIKDVSENYLADQRRITRLGKFMRSTSLDEIPQLWNVLLGEMSLVGPRPLLTEYLALYNSHQIRRQEVRPGISGWAQVNGRNAISWEEKFNYDLFYVDHMSFLFDLKILLRTVQKLIYRNHDNFLTEKFTG
jgi:undecaprenyl phosphate N,N'-diacetylbacillosamine 1-phosphate transferase